MVVGGPHDGGVVVVVGLPPLQPGLLLVGTGVAADVDGVLNGLCAEAEKGHGWSLPGIRGHIYIP